MTSSIGVKELLSKKDLRGLRAVVWNKRGEVGVSNVHFNLQCNEVFASPKGNPKEEDYSTFVSETLFLVVSDERMMVTQVVRPGMWGQDLQEVGKFGLSPEMDKLMKDIMKLSEYFKGLEVYQSFYSPDREEITNKISD